MSFDGSGDDVRLGVRVSVTFAFIDGTLGVVLQIVLGPELHVNTPEVEIIDGVDVGVTAVAFVFVVLCAFCSSNDVDATE